MSEMVERVARALAYKTSRRLNVAEPAWPEGWSDENIEQFRSDARAAIEAMRIPTPKMRFAVNTMNEANRGRIFPHGLGDNREWWNDLNEEHAVWYWQAMIDEALK